MTSRGLRLDVRGGKMVKNPASSKETINIIILYAYLNVNTIRDDKCSNDITLAADCETDLLKKHLHHS